MKSEVKKMSAEQIKEICEEICFSAENEEDAESKIQAKLGLTAKVAFPGCKIPGEDRPFTGLVERPGNKESPIYIGN